MTMRLRSSKYRHVFGQESRDQHCWTGLRVSKKSVEGSLIAANHRYIAVIWQSAGGGAFTVMDATKPVKVNPAAPPLCRGHTSGITDLSFNPFVSDVIASAGEDGAVNLWTLPETLPSGGFSDVTQSLKAHRQKVMVVAWHPSASSVIASTSQDKTIHVWDAGVGASKVKLTGLLGTPMSLEWSPDGRLFATSSKDKTLRLWDPRAGSTVAEVTAHTSAKGFNTTFLTDSDMLATVGHSRTSERELCKWDARSLTEPLCRLSIDTGSGSYVPYFDRDTGVLFLGARGDSNIRYYEVVSTPDQFFALATYKSTVPQVGLALSPKYANNVMGCEIAKFFKVSNQGQVSVLSMIVPRKSDLFQDDIFPDTCGWTAAQDADAWFGGADAQLAKISLEGGVDLSAVGGGTFEATKPVAEQLAEAQARIAELEAELATLRGS